MQVSKSAFNAFFFNYLHYYKVKGKVKFYDYFPMVQIFPKKDKFTNQDNITSYRTLVNI